MRRLFTIALIAAGATAQIVPAQPGFEVASVRLNKTGIRGGSMDFSKGGERFTAINMPIGALVLIAYNITVRQVSGADAFLSDKYDIVAKAEHPVTSDRMLRMLQALLVDRFKLIVHWETREVPVFALTVAKGGSKLRESNPAEVQPAVPRTPAHAGGTELRSGHLVFKAESMPDFAWALSRMAGIGDRIIVDNTGLKGNYDFELLFERDTPSQGAAPNLGPSIFSALQEQLGLKLESKKAPVDFLVIDHIEKPSEN
jgi:uncharacterized protein (TIGR03435 family)